MGLDAAAARGGDAAATTGAGDDARSDPDATRERPIAPTLARDLCSRRPGTRAPRSAEGGDLGLWSDARPSHRSAAELWRIAPKARGPVDVSVPRGFRNLPGIRLHRRAEFGTTRLVKGIPSSTPGQGAPSSRRRPAETNPRRADLQPAASTPERQVFRSCFVPPWVRWNGVRGSRTNVPAVVREGPPHPILRTLPSRRWTSVVTRPTPGSVSAPCASPTPRSSIVPTRFEPSSLMRSATPGNRGPRPSPRFRSDGDLPPWARRPPPARHGGAGPRRARRRLR
jgi:hypothetical protein